MTPRSAHRTRFAACHAARILCAGATIFALRSAGAQTPDTDIWLADLTTRAGHLAVGAPRNLTARPGYDNQPAWAADGRSIFFTSVRDDAQADIYRLDVATRATTRVTITAPESEYSATLMPGERALSVIRVERDSTQRLWRVPLDGGPSTVIFEGIKPVGYHAWADSGTAVLFVLGAPNTLQIADRRTGRGDTVATNVGRSLHKVPGQPRVSFVRKISRTEWWIELLDPRTRRTERLVQLPKGVEDYTWTPAGIIIAGDGSLLKAFDPKQGGGWQTIGDLGSAGIAAITRLAVSPRGNALAIVAEHRAAQ